MLKSEFLEFNEGFQMFFVAEKCRKTSRKVRLDLKEPRSMKR